MKLKAMRGQDIEHFRHLQPEGWPDIAPEFEYYVNMPFCHPVKVVFKKRIVGIGAGISLGNTAWLAHIIVDKGFRRRGIGSFIVTQLLHHLTEAGCQTVSLIATELGYPVYKKAGFLAQTEYIFFARQAPCQSFPPSGNIVPLTAGDFAAVFSLDKQVAGEERKRLLGAALDNGYVYKKNGEVLGYYLPALGEGPVVATDGEAGTALMALKYAAAPKGVLPAANREGMSFFKENGFGEIMRAVRMYRGREFPWQPQNIFSRIGGNLG
ncbi:MAG TPA: hypothetical protein DEA44_05515 [Firmicutes bacterium]|nr:hypothetical protein [Bacillota bacterium]HWR55093.1 GNAT family N-acetyltransferase [Negativicutes bacterium]